MQKSAICEELCQDPTNMIDKSIDFTYGLTFFMIRKVLTVLLNKKVLTATINV